MTPEQRLASIKEKLQKGIELELATIPPYLTALFSIRPGSNAAAAEIIRSVVMEEMLHMLLAGNTLSAVGGAVRLGKKNIPRYPVQMEFRGKRFKNRLFDIHLAKFSRDTIQVFLHIELPDGMQEEKAELDAIIIPGYTIGEFYKGIKSDLEVLCAEIGEAAVFVGSKDKQLSEQHFWRGGGSPIVVQSLEDAKKAIDLIVEQGEGTSWPPSDIGAQFFSHAKDVPHYFRFNEINYEQLYRVDDDPTLPPTGEAIKIDYDNVYPLKTSCRSSDLAQFPDLKYLNNAFNAAYSNMLKQLEEGFNGNPAAFYTAILNGMRKLAPIAATLVQIPIPGDPNGAHAAPSFEWNKHINQRLS